jgi:hypothetical protein
MSQSLLYHAFGVREGYDYKETLYEDGCIRFVLSVKPDWIRCPACGGKDIVRKGRRYRDLRCQIGRCLGFGFGLKLGLTHK